MRALEQRAAYDAAKLKQDAEAAARQARMDITKAQNDDIRLGLDLSRERRAQAAESIDLKKNKAEMALKERDDKREQRALDEAPDMLLELESARLPSGYIPTDRELAIRLKYPFAAFSKNARIAKVWDDERSLRENLSATEAANNQNIEKEKRAEQVKIDAEKRAMEAAAADRARLAEIAPEMPVTQVVSDGVTRKMPDVAKPKEEKPDTWDDYEKALAAARKSLSIPVAKNAKDQIPLPPEIQAQFEARGTALTKGGTTKAPTIQPQFTVGNPSGTTAGSSAPVAHPMEGQVVKQKSTGKTGTIVNGVFVEQ